MRPESRLGTVLRTVETALLGILLTAMVGVATYQIVARNLFGTGLAWGLDLVHVGMLWATMIGAVAAARHDSHISIDLVARFGGPRLQRFAARATALFAAVLCGALAWYSVEVVKWDFIDGTHGIAAVPAWICESIIPVAAAVMSLTYLLRAVWPNPASPADIHFVGAPPDEHAEGAAAQSVAARPDHTP